MRHFCISLITLCCLGGSATAETLQVRVPNDLTYLEWGDKHDVTGDVQIIFNVMEGLVEPGPRGEPMPALAERWEIVDGGNAYVFHLRKGVKWTDGMPLTARDFVYAWRRVLNPATRSGYAFYLDFVKNAVAFRTGKLKDATRLGLEALDDHRFKVTLERPISHLLHMLYYYIAFPQREDLIKKHGKNWWRPEHLVTLGPYKIASWKKGAQIELTRNPTYYGTAPSIDTIKLKVVRDNEEALRLAEQGELDVVSGPSTKEVSRLAEKKWRLEAFSAFNIRYVAFNVDAPLGRDPDFRKAIALSIDRERIASELADGSIAAQALIPQNLPEFEPLALPFNVEKAKALFGKKPRRFKAVYFETTVEAAQFIKKELFKNLGVDLELVYANGEDFEKRVRGERNPMYIRGWGADFRDVSGFLQMLTPNSGFNMTGWKDSEFTSLVSRGEASSNLGDRLRLFSEAQRLLLQRDVVLIPLYHRRDTVLLSPRIDHLELFPTLQHYYYKRVKLK